MHIKRKTDTNKHLHFVSVANLHRFNAALRCKIVNNKMSTSKMSTMFLNKSKTYFCRRLGHRCFTGYTPRRFTRNLSDCFTEETLTKGRRKLPGKITASVMAKYSLRTRWQ